VANAPRLEGTTKPALSQAEGNTGGKNKTVVAQAFLPVPQRRLESLRYQNNRRKLAIGLMQRSRIKGQKKNGIPEEAVLHTMIRPSIVIQQIGLPK